MGRERESVEGFEWLNFERNARSFAIDNPILASDSGEQGVGGSGTRKAKKGKGKKSKRGSQASEGSKARREFAAARRAEKEAEDKDELTQQFRKLKVLQREEELNQLRRYRRLQIDPDHHGDEIPWSHTFGTPIKHMRRERPKSAGIFRNSLDMDEDEVYRGFLKSDKKAAKTLRIDVKELKNPVHRLYGPSPQRGKVRPKSAHTFTPKSAEFKNVYQPRKVFERSYSGRCIKEKLKNDKSASDLVAVEVAARERWMKDRLLACIAEANVYSRALNEPYFYRIYLKVQNEHTRDQEVEAYVESVRYDQLFVEVINIEQLESSGDISGKKSKTQTQSVKGGSVASTGNFASGTRMMSANRFFEDHTKMFQEIRRRRRLMARSQAKAERLLDKRSNPMDRNKREQKEALNQPHGFNPTTIDGMFSKEKAYEQLKIILSELIGCRMEIENQCKDIRARGWNLYNGNSEMANGGYLGNRDNGLYEEDDVW